MSYTYHKSCTECNIAKGHNSFDNIYSELCKHCKINLIRERMLENPESEPRVPCIACKRAKLILTDFYLAGTGLPARTCKVCHLSQCRARVKPSDPTHKHAQPQPQNEWDEIQCKTCKEYKDLRHYARFKPNVTNFGYARHCNTCAARTRRVARDPNGYAVMGKELFIKKFNQNKEEIFNV